MSERRTGETAGTNMRRVILEWRPGAAPVAGLVRLDTGAVRPFTGWIDLMAVLQEVAAGDANTAGQQSPGSSRPAGLEGSGADG